MRNRVDFILFERSLLDKYGEEILYPQISEFFSRQTYSVGIKVKVDAEEADVVCKKSNSDIKIIEVKSFFSWNAWKDSLKYINYCSELYFAIGSGSYISAENKTKQYVINKLSEYGCGLILVDLINSKIILTKRAKEREIVKHIPNLNVRIKRKNWALWSKKFPWYGTINKPTLVKFLKKYKTISRDEILYLFKKGNYSAVLKILKQLEKADLVIKFHHPETWILKQACSQKIK